MVCLKRKKSFILVIYRLIKVKTFEYRSMQNQFAVSDCHFEPARGRAIRPLFVYTTHQQDVNKQASNKNIGQNRVVCFSPKSVDIR